MKNVWEFPDQLYVVRNPADSVSLLFASDDLADLRSEDGADVPAAVYRRVEDVTIRTQVTAVSSTPSEETCPVAQALSAPRIKGAGGTR